jgi:hypothetical protein
MAERKKPKLDAPTAKAGQPAVTIEVAEGEATEVGVARAAVGPIFGAAATVMEFNPLQNFTNVNEVAQEMRRQVKAVTSGDMSRAEGMLAAQAHTLDTLFHALAQRAGKNIAAGYVQAGDTYFRMALKAQSQCRSTLETLSEVKNPRGATFIKQQNVAQQQQVNNGVTPDSRTNTRTPAHEKDITPTNELLEKSNGERLDAGTQGAASGADKELAAVGRGNRAKDRGRESA